MPHVSIKHFPVGLTLKEKKDLSDIISSSIQSALQCSEDVISVSMEEVVPEDWAMAVYQPEIEAKRQYLIKQPNY
ncbi:tautomerase family protein [Vibrio metschnikovii]|uniref:tautomerase family protein n=1 Tax=Vibrio metschnikovii TaxID=28172 RepID=UPI00164535C8|nr:tautomerase family protein [Vibrio metschnikovii]MBC3621706.1 tautomerase family protein [Vibrio metschnikovii]